MIQTLIHYIRYVFDKWKFKIYKYTAFVMSYEPMFSFPKVNEKLSWRQEFPASVTICLRILKYHKVEA